MLTPRRRYSAQNSYRYGFNGKENDNEAKGEGDQQDYGMRIYDPRLGRFLSVDPLTKDYPWNSCFAYAENSPISNVDLDGAERASPEFLDKVRKLSDLYREFVLRDKSLLSQTTDQKVIKLLNEQLSYNKAIFSKLITFIYKHTSNDSEKTLYYMLKSVPYIQKGLDFTPVGDVKVLVSGKNFSGEEKSRWAAAGFLVIDIFGGEIIGAAGKTISSLSKGMKYAYKYGKCVQFAKEFVTKYSKGLKEAGLEFKVYEINIGKGGLIGNAEKRFADNGMHQFIEVTKDGKAWIFDNLHPDGVLKEDYIKNLAAHTSTNQIIEGQKLIDGYAKEITDAVKGATKSKK